MKSSQSSAAIPSEGGGSPDGPSAATTTRSSTPIIDVRDIHKTYGPTKAVNGVDLHVNEGEVVGLVGANGAGKSVMMRILAGVTRPDNGSLLMHGRPVHWHAYGPLAAKGFGVRIVFQELSLCTNLRVYENFFLERSRLIKGKLRWRGQARELAKRSLQAVFPGNDIDVNARVGNLPIAQQQMVEIARAVDDPDARLLILDEPTSSLPREQTQQLLAFMDGRQKLGVSFIFISHRLNEILAVTDRIYVMQNGVVKCVRDSDETSEEELVAMMGECGERSEAACEEEVVLSAPIQNSGTETGVEIDDLNTPELHGINLSMKGGEIVGIAGLDGSGQRDLLQAIFQPKKAVKHVRRTGKIAYVTGDRKTEGNFGLWSVARNMIIAKLARGRLFARIKRKQLNPIMLDWYRQLCIKGTGLDGGIASLSGGNQQKVLIARAMISEADIIILDDPTRGVDIATKRLLYRILKESAAKGKLIIWYSTEDEEFEYCSAVAVMHEGEILQVLDKDQATKENIVNVSFSKKGEKSNKRIAGAKGGIDMTGIVIPLAVMLGLFALCGAMSHNVFSPFGIELLLSGAIPLVFVTLSQTFIVGISHVDIGIGNYMGLVNVLCSTVLLQSTSLGALALLGCVAVYTFMGFLIHWRKLPAIVVTLGFSFIWTGVAYTIQSQPGGRAPSWLTDVYAFQPPFLPRAIYIIAAITLIAFWVHRSKYGTVLRGFGNNPQSMRRSGRSETWAYIINYSVSGIFGLLGGLLVTAITTASDANASTSYTMLSVAAVIIGGGALTGGMVSPFGAVCGAVTLSLIATLMGFFNISSSYVMAVQGAILLIVLALRLLRREKEQ